MGSKNENQRGEIVIYKTSKGEVNLKVQFENETIWLDAHQMAKIFNVNRPGIVKHINNIYKTKELNKKATCSILEQVAADGKIRKMNIYNLDMIISVGYRVNSAKATKFRIWATGVLKKYITDGYAINRQRLEDAQNKFRELQTTIAFLQKNVTKKQLKGQEQEIIALLADYSKTLTLLENYDKQKIKKPKGKKIKFVLKYEDVLPVLTKLKENLVKKKEATNLFGMERDMGIDSILKNLYQTFSGKDLYTSIEERAANLLYLVIKDHPLTDGNKRTASFLFVYFLDKADYLYKETGERKINDNTLTALALLVAESNPKDKEIMVKLIMNLITN